MEFTFPDSILQKVLLHTNEEIIRRTATYEQKTSYSGKTTMYELKAFIVLLYLAGELKAGHVNVKDFRSEIFGSAVCRATISVTRFEFLTLCIRFDDKTSRPERKINDRFAAIREIWDMFIANFKMYYSPSVYCTVDEQLPSIPWELPI
jgi:hypothetical protein